MDKRILLVDDDSETLAILRHFVTSQGYAVETAENGAQALDVLATNDIHVLVTDFYMPGMKGIHLVEVVRSRHPNIPILMVTGYASEEDLQACLEAGIEDYLPKPIHFDTFRQMLKRAVVKADRLRGLFPEGEEPNPANGSPPPNPLEGEW